MRILLEMFYPMKTCMQGVEVQKELRKPVIIILDDFLLLSKIDELAALLHNEHVQISEMEPVEEYLNDDKLICYFQENFQDQLARVLCVLCVSTSYNIHNIMP
ncbi:hypothetical protein T4E_11113 [Trichinella pseudospiralis]|uniref:Uncharacterized protein n=1 Tax=Trichinella pseudospiralis TaxID=6337 RepID=A0A0V0Y0U7_TRIPS|nr:hypothetical protein T4E_11113 [Trichinella pseudospiralis]